MVFVPTPGILSYSHVQSTAASTWTITHNLGKSTMAVDTFIDVGNGLETVIPHNISFPDANTVVIEWTSARSGTARLA